MELSNICTRHQTDLNIQEKIIELIKNVSDGKELSFSSRNLQNRLGFVKKIERNSQAEQLKHKDMVVSLATGGRASVAVFKLEAMIISLLLDESIIHPDYIAQGYNLLTGKPNGLNDKYGEIHLGDAWEPARQFFCGDYTPNHNMPLAIVIFGDEFHLDLKGSLKTMPIKFTLSCFNQKARNCKEFSHPMTYIPNWRY